MISVKPRVGFLLVMIYFFTENGGKPYCLLALLVPAVFTAQPAGLPEILKKSLHSCSVRGGDDVFIIGKNFLKDAKVIFHENVSGKKYFFRYV